MAILWADSCDHLATGMETAKWSAYIGGGGPCTYNTEQARTGTQSLKIYNYAGIEKSLTPGGTGDEPLTCHWAFAIWQNAQNAMVWEISNADGIQIWAERYADNNIVVYRGGGETYPLGYTPNGSLPGAQWNHVEIKVLIKNSGGTLDVWINGVNKLALTGLDTQAQTSGGWSKIYFGVGNGTYYVDDIVVADGSASQTQIGDVRVWAFMPTADGSNTGFVPMTGAGEPHYAEVDEPTPDSDSSYVSSDSAGARDTYSFQEVALTGTVLGVQSCAYARKTDSGTRTLDAVVYSGGNYDFGSPVALSTSYACATHMWLLNPQPSPDEAWTIATVNSSEFGFKVG